jgi:hypothetical protein
MGVDTSEGEGVFGPRLEPRLRMSSLCNVPIRGWGARPPLKRVVPNWNYKAITALFILVVTLSKKVMDS